MESRLVNNNSGEAIDFKGNRFINIADLNTETWRKLWSDLENFSNKFVKNAQKLGIYENYRWPPDPLHDWQRCWEYPFALWYIRKYVPKERTILDVGSGITFYPHFLTYDGYNVIATDVVQDYSKLSDKIHLSMFDSLEKFKYIITDASNFGGIGDCLVDCITNISVIEHMPNPKRAIENAHRILKSKGLLILTFDVSINHRQPLQGKDTGLIPHDFSEILDLLRHYFKSKDQDYPRHPMDILTSENWKTFEIIRNMIAHPLILTKKKSLTQRIFPLRQLPLKVIRKISKSHNIQWSVYGSVWEKS